MVYSYVISYQYGIERNLMKIRILPDFPMNHWSGVLDLEVNEEFKVLSQIFISGMIQMCGDLKLNF